MIDLVRFAYLPGRTIGRMTYGEHWWWTIEREWKNNEPFESCIPNGVYPMVRVNSPRFGEQTWEIAEVPNRTHILIHIANTANNVEGCIGLGNGLWPNLKGIGPSGPAIREFYELTKDIETEEIMIRSGAVKA